jgi:hypothetical protein
MNRRNFIKSAVVASVGFPAIANSLTPTEKSYKIRDTGIIHHMTGPHFQFIQEENGEMFCRDMCDCGCIDKKWKINEGDTIVAWRPCLTGNLKGLTVISIECKFYRTTILTGCRLLARDFEKYP